MQLYAQSLRSFKKELDEMGNEIVCCVIASFVTFDVRNVQNIKSPMFGIKSTFENVQSDERKILAPFVQRFS